MTNKKFEDKSNQNNRNSHLPPSSDPIRIKAAIAQKKGGKRGGKKGHNFFLTNTYPQLTQIVTKSTKKS